MKIRQIGKFRILEVVGEGSFGKVYKGIDRTNNQEVALKFIARKGKSKRQIENLRQEIQILKKLQHPNIISFKEHIETQTELIVITEFAGKDLAAVLQAKKKFKTDEVRQYASQILSALLYLNDHRIVHRDLKPQNILIKDGMIKICDFGFARKMSAMTMCLTSMKGTPLYIAPEIVSQKPYNHKIDIWSLGVILFQLYNGFTPFYAESYHKLLPKILNDKVKYPKDMDLSLRELIDGMLQKSPTSRYDWQQITQHPFMKHKSVLSEVPVDSNINNEKNVDQFDNCFPMDPKNLMSSNLNGNADKVQITELKWYEEEIKAGKQIGKELKTNIMFYHKLVSLFSFYSQGQLVSKEYLVLAMRVLSRLLQIKLEGDAKDDDITKKQDLLFSIINMIQHLEDDEVLTQAYNMVGFLLKNNFDSINFDLDVGEKLIDSARLTLLKDKLSNGVFLNLMKVLGILAAQSLITLRMSQQFFVIVGQSKLLSLIAGKFVPDKDICITMFECLVKFIHPAKGETPTKTQQFITVLGDMKRDVAAGFLAANSIPHFVKMNDTYSQSQLSNFHSVLYQCVKMSHEFRRAFINTKQSSLLSKIPLFNVPMAYYMMKLEKSLVINLDTIKLQISKEVDIQYPVHRAFEINLLILATSKNADLSIKLQQMRFYLKKITDILKLEDGVKEKSIGVVEGWAFDCHLYKFDDLAVSALVQLFTVDMTLQKEFFATCDQLNLFENILRTKNNELNISFKYFVKLLPFFIHHYKESRPSKKLTTALGEALLVYLSPDEFNKFKTSQPKEAVIQYVQNCFVLIQEMTYKDDKKLQDFLVKTETINLHRIILDEDHMDQKLLPLSLKLLYRIIQKTSPCTLDFVAVNGLPKLKRFCKQKPSSLTLEVIQIISHMARAKCEYYPNIAQLKIVELIPKWLCSQNQQLTYRTLNLVGNLAKHSTYFFEEFEKHKVVAAINNSIHFTKNFEKNVIYAVGNISFYNEQFKEDIKPLIPYLCKALDLDDDHLLSNAISTLSNLLRHSNSYLKQLTGCNVIAKILGIIQKTKSPNVTQFGLNFVLKTVNYPELMGTYREPIRKSLRRVVYAPDSEIGRKIQKIQEKL